MTQGGSEKTPRSIGFIVSSALLGLATIALLRLRYPEPWGMDQGLFACFGRWVPQGWIPYQQIWDSKPPLTLAIYPVAMSLFGHSPQSVWVFEGLALLVTMGLAFAVGRCVFGRWEGLAAAALVFVGLWSPGWGDYWSRAQAEQFAAIPVLAAALFAWRAREHAISALVCGLFIGICSLLKVPALALLGAWPLVWWLESRDLLAAVKKTALLTAGAALVWIVTVASFTALGARAEMLDAVFAYNRVYADLIGASTSWPSVVAQFAVTLGGSVPLALAASVLALVVLVRKPTRLAWLAGWILFSCFAVIAQRQLAGYHFQLVVPSLALAGGFGICATVRGCAKAGGARIVAALALVGFLAAGVVAVRQWATAYEPHARLAMGQIDAPTFYRSFDRGFFSPAAEREVARYVSSQTSDSDGILVWGLSPGIYALSGRYPVTRYPFHHVLLTESPLSSRYGLLSERRERFMEGLLADRPAFVIVGSKDRNGFEPEDSVTQMLRFPEFRRFVQQAYQEDRRIGPFILYRRMGLPPR